MVNSSLAVTGAGVFVAVKSTLDPGGAVNEGAFRPIELRAPAASVVDVRSDAPAGAHGEVRKRAVSVALGALSQIIPERVSGDLCGTSFPNSIGGWNHRRERQYVYYEAPAGGNGGFAAADGSSAFANVDFGNIRTIQTAESIENEMPLLVERCELRADSGGEGAQRGGMGLHREIRVLGEEGSYSVLSDRAAIPPFGVGGGTSSHSYRVAVRRNGTENVFPTPGKVTGHPVRRDDVVIMESAGGGGYGDPLERDPESVRADVQAGFVSAERAREGYGVVLDAAGEVDGRRPRPPAKPWGKRGSASRCARTRRTPTPGSGEGAARSGSPPRSRSGWGSRTMISWSCSAPTPRRFAPGCGSTRARPMQARSGWTISAVACSGSAGATPWCSGASRSRAPRAAWLIPPPRSPGATPYGLLAASRAESARRPRTAVDQGLPAGSAVARAARRYGSALLLACVRELEDGGNPGREAIALRSVELVPVRGESAKKLREPRVADRDRSRPRPGGGTPTSGRNGVAEPRTGDMPGASRAVLRLPDGEADAQRTADGVGAGEAGVMASQDSADRVSRQSVGGGRAGHRTAAERSGNRRAIVFAGPFHRGIYAMPGRRWDPLRVAIA